MTINKIKSNLFRKPWLSIYFIYLGDPLHSISTSRIKPRWERTPAWWMLPRPRNTFVTTTGAREKSSYTKINIGSYHVVKQSARIFVSTRPSITLRIRRQTCNARSCRPRPLGSSRSSSRPTPRTNRRLRGNTLGIHSRSGIRPLLLQNPSLSGHRARGTITGRPD